MAPPCWSATTVSATSQIIEYANILQQDGIGSDRAKAFYAHYRHERDFIKRAEVVNGLFANRRVLANKVQKDPSARTASTVMRRR